MNLERYEFESNPDNTKFSFVSEGKNGRVNKEILFQPIFIDYYNLAFGDKCETTGDFDSWNVTDNGDAEKVLLTIVAAVYYFLDHHPNADVYISGNTPARTRMYRMGINKQLMHLRPDLTLTGWIDGRWEIYQKGREYGAFGIYKRNK